MNPRLESTFEVQDNYKTTNLFYYSIIYTEKYITNTQKHEYKQIEYSFQNLPIGK